MGDSLQGYHEEGLAELASDVWDADATVLGGVWEMVSAGLGGEACWRSSDLVWSESPPGPSV